MLHFIIRHGDLKFLEGTAERNFKPFEASPQEKSQQHSRQRMKKTSTQRFFAPTAKPQPPNPVLFVLDFSLTKREVKAEDDQKTNAASVDRTQCLQNTLVADNKKDRS